MGNLFFLFNKQTPILWGSGRGTLPQNWSFKRASTGTYVDRNSLVQTALSDVPRFDCVDGNTPSCLLYEDQRTNLLLNSSNILATGWSKAGGQNTTITNAGAPDGTATFNHWIRTATTASYFVQAVTKSTVSLPYAFSCYAKAGDNGRYLAVRIQGSYPARTDACFDLQSGTVGSITNNGTNFSGSASMRYCGNGIYRCIVQTTGTDATDKIYSYISFNSNGSNQVDATDSSNNSDGYIWGQQLEQALSASSYIPTTGTSVTRAADALSFTIPLAVHRLVFLFENGTQQTVDVAAGPYTVPTTLNRARIVAIKGY